VERLSSRRMATPSAAYAAQGSDLVRSELEVAWLARLIRSLVRRGGARSLLDLGCGDRLAARLAPVDRYLGVDLTPAPGVIAHDLRDGLGPVGPEPFDLYLGGFGIASHLPPASLRHLLGKIAAHARPGSLVALEALGARSLEWPRLWDTPLGAARTISYRLGADVPVHPWKPDELLPLFEAAGIRPLRVLDRTVQAGPKLGTRRYWPALPALRAAVAALLAGGRPAAALTAPLPPLPAGRTALLHQTLAARRRALVGSSGLRGAALARALWRLDPPTGGGYGHGLMVVGVVC
jgi:hypothetical protein